MVKVTFPPPKVPGVSGTVTSENYPSNYDNSLDKTYNIEAGSGKKIKITFEDLDIENHASCGYDYVMIKVKEKLLIDNHEDDT